jgi:hypothetical protein
MASKVAEVPDERPAQEMMTLMGVATGHDSKGGVEFPTAPFLPTMITQ